MILKNENKIHTLYRSQVIHSRAKRMRAWNALHNKVEWHMLMKNIDFKFIIGQLRFTYAHTHS